MHSSQRWCGPKRQTHRFALPLGRSSGQRDARLRLKAGVVGTVVLVTSSDSNVVDSQDSPGSIDGLR